MHGRAHGWMQSGEECGASPEHAAQLHAGGSTWQPEAGEWDSCANSACSTTCDPIGACVCASVFVIMYECVCAWVCVRAREMCDCLCAWLFEHACGMCAHRECVPCRAGPCRAGPCRAKRTVCCRVLSWACWRLQPLLRAMCACACRVRTMCVWCGAVRCGALRRRAAPRLVHACAYARCSCVRACARACACVSLCVCARACTYACAHM